VKEELLTNVLRRLVSSEELPKDCKPIDLLLVTRLLLQKADEKDVTVSRGTFALNLGCSERTIYDSQQRLLEFGWITLKKGAHKGQVNRIGVVLDKLPLDADLKKTIASDDAKEVAGRYRTFLKKQDPRRRFFKGSLQRSEFRFQTLLKKCDGRKELLIAVINFGLKHPAFRDSLLKGPHLLVKHWKALWKAYDEADETQQSRLLGYFVWFTYLALVADAPNVALVARLAA
jgi:hypothetical protein